MATSGFEAFAKKEIQERRINPNLPPEEDPPSHRLIREVDEYVKTLSPQITLALTSPRSLQRLKRLRNAPQMTAASASPASTSVSLFGSLWAISGSASQVDPFEDHTMQVRRSHDKALVRSRTSLVMISQEFNLFLIACL